MNYEMVKTASRLIYHKFTKGGTMTEKFYNGVIKKWDDVNMRFMEHPTDSDKRRFSFVINYRNSETKDFQYNSFHMNEDEIKQFLEVVNKIVNEPSKFNYQIGDGFIIPSVTIEKVNCGDYMGKSIYFDVKATIINIYEYENVVWYILSFDGEQLIVKSEYLDNLRRC